MENLSDAKKYELGDIVTAHLNPRHDYGIITSREEQESYCDKLSIKPINPNESIVYVKDAAGHCIDYLITEEEWYANPKRLFKQEAIDMIGSNIMILEEARDFISSLQEKKRKSKLLLELEEKRFLTLQERDKIVEEI